MTELVTEAFNSSIRECHATIYHFIKHNNWFIGKIYLLTTSDNYPTEDAIRTIKQIYNNIEIINVSTNESFTSSLNSAKITRSNIWRYSILIDTYRLLYLSNFSTVTSSLAKIVNENTTFISRDASVFYLNGKRPELTLNLSNQEIISSISSKNTTVSVTDEIIYSSDILDKLFSRSAERLRNAKVIVFDTLTSNLSNSTRINSVRINSIRETSSYLSSPAAKTIVKRAVYTPIPKSGTPNNKTANTEDLVKKHIKKPTFDPRYVLDPKKIAQSNLDIANLNSTVYTDSLPFGDWQVACIIAFQSRHNIVAKNVEYLSRQTHIPAIILVASNFEDASFATELTNTYSNVFVKIFDNYPIGGKWQAGVDYAKLLNVKGVIILGSDDILSLNYIENCFNRIDLGRGSSGVGVDLIGNRSWYIYDTYKNLYQLKYTNMVPIFLGGGRMFSKYFLDSVDWVIFDKTRPVHLDEYGYHSVKKFSNSLAELDDTNLIISIKGSWDMINTSSRILSANNRVTITDITQSKDTFFNNLQITNIDDYLI